MVYSNQEYSKSEYYDIIPKNRLLGDFAGAVGISASTADGPMRPRTQVAGDVGIEPTHSLLESDILPLY